MKPAIVFKLGGKFCRKKTKKGNRKRVLTQKMVTKVVWKIFLPPNRILFSNNENQNQYNML